MNVASINRDHSAHAMKLAKEAEATLEVGDFGYLDFEDIARVSVTIVGKLGNGDILIEDDQFTAYTVDAREFYAS